MGLEPTPEEYVDKMVAIFREVRRVLRDDGTCWLNLGDSYASDMKGDNRTTTHLARPDDNFHGGQKRHNNTVPRKINHGLKPKDLVGIPWRVAFALQADGWWLRSDIIWHKPNPMPESVTDRPTKAHEYVFLLTKSARYYYDADAIREPQAEASEARYCASFHTGEKESSGAGRPDSASNTPGMKLYNPAGRNRRTVWTIATRPYSGAHFATFPPALVEPCILAGTSAKGACPECGAPWERVMEKGELVSSSSRTDVRQNQGNGETSCTRPGHALAFFKRERTTTGWRPTCDCGREDVTPCLVLDPFCGSGTTGMVAIKHGREFVGLDLSGEYLSTLAIERLNKIQRVLL